MATAYTATFGLTFGDLVVGKSSSITSVNDDTASVTKTETNDTTGVLIDIGNIGTVGGIFILNKNTTAGDDLLISLDGGTEFDITIAPEAFTFIPQPGGAVWAKAASGKTVTYYAAAFEL